MKRGINEIVLFLSQAFVCLSCHLPFAFLLPVLRFQVLLVWTAVVVKVSQMNLVFGGPLETEQDREASDMDSKAPTSMAINVLDSNFHDFDMECYEGSFRGNQVWSGHDDGGNSTVK